MNGLQVQDEALNILGRRQPPHIDPLKELGESPHRRLWRGSAPLVGQGLTPPHHRGPYRVFSQRLSP
jgi:hypothetical protein